MLYSTLHSKNTNEDPKTSSIVGSMLLLPDCLFFRILQRACHPTEMPRDCGLITGSEFWPLWFDDTHNARFVEPDVIIHCEHRDIIIEAKHSDTSGQYRDQWVKEIDAYQKIYGKGKDLYFIALGGNEDYSREDVDGIPILKCSWTSLLMAVMSVQSELEQISFRDEHVSQTLRILEFLKTSFAVHGVLYVSPLNASDLNNYTVVPCSSFFENLSL